MPVLEREVAKRSGEHFAGGRGDADRSRCIDMTALHVTRLTYSSWTIGPMHVGYSLHVFFSVALFWLLNPTSRLNGPTVDGVYVLDAARGMPPNSTPASPSTTRMDEGMSVSARRADVLTLRLAQT